MFLEPSLWGVVSVLAAAGAVVWAVVSGVKKGQRRRLGGGRESAPGGTSEGARDGGQPGGLCLLKGGPGRTDMHGPQLSCRGTLRWPDGRNHVGSFCQGLEHG